MFLNQQLNYEHGNKSNNCLERNSLVPWYFKLVIHTKSTWQVVGLKIEQKDLFFLKFQEPLKIFTHNANFLLII